MEAARPAEPVDVERIAVLVRELRAELAPMRGGALWAAQDAREEPLEAAITELLAAADHAVTVGTIDGTVVGVGILRCEALQDGSRLGVVTELYVEPDAREVGVGEVLAAALVEQATAWGCVGVDALALPGHRATKNFFEEQGFTARALTMHKPLR